MRDMKGRYRVSKKGRSTQVKNMAQSLIERLEVVTKRPEGIAHGEVEKRGWGCWGPRDTP